MKFIKTVKVFATSDAVVPFDSEVVSWSFRVVKSVTKTVISSEYKPKDFEEYDLFGELLSHTYYVYTKEVEDSMLF